MAVVDPRLKYQNMAEFKKNKTFFSERPEVDWLLFEDWTKGATTQELVAKYNRPFDKVLGVILSCSMIYDHWRVEKCKEVINE